MNIRCSNRCAKPVRPGCSRAEPTWYHMLTVDDRHAVILVQDHVQAVRQRELRVRHRERRRPRRRFSGRRCGLCRYVRDGRAGDRKDGTRDAAGSSHALPLRFL